ncbi:hypothetical protein HMPREF0880_00237 [Yokenella regensburgei ATCC 43003]|jgi:hypothetical protein|nr:hypothetical protein HMPREF0880_00237 [Yokenella regensburgei ATCC 43003]
MFREYYMSLLIKGINTGVICHGNHFLALALKIKHQKNKEASFFLPALVLRDLLIALEYHLWQHAAESPTEQEQRLHDKRCEAKKLRAHVPAIIAEELSHADIQRRVAAVTLVASESTHLLFTFTLNNGRVVEIRVEENQIEVLIIAMIQAINNAGMHELALRLSSLLDFLPLYDIECRSAGSLEYDSYDQPAWKHRLFTRYLALVYRYSDDAGDIQTSGAVIKTRSPSESEETKAISRRLMNFSPRLGKLKGRPCQVYIREMKVTHQEVLSREQCLEAVHQLQRQVSRNP